MHLNIRSDCEISGVLSIWCFKKCEMFVNCFRIKARFWFVWKFNGKHVLFYEHPSGRANRCLNRCRPLVPFLWDFRSPPPPKHVRRKHPSPARHKNWFVCVWARGGGALGLANGTNRCRRLFKLRYNLTQLGHLTNSFGMHRLSIYVVSPVHGTSLMT